MAHFAYIENGVVREHPVAKSSVIVVANSDCGNLPFPESESVGQEFIANLGFDGLWLQTSYNKNFRKRYAQLGSIYDENLDIFINPKPAPWFVLDADFNWKCPENINPLTGAEYTAEELAVINLNRLAEGAQMPQDN